MTKAAGIPDDIIIEQVKKFKAVEHRIEYVATKNGVDYYIMIPRELTQRQQLRLLKLWLNLQFLSAEVMIKAQNSTFM